MLQKLFSMFSFLSLLLLLMVAFYITCGPVHANNSTQLNSVYVFVPRETSVPWRADNVVRYKVVLEFDMPSIVAADGVMVVLARVFYDDIERYSDIVASSLETGETDWVRRATANNGANWKSELATRGVRGRAGYLLRNHAAVIKNSKIYLLSTYTSYGGGGYSAFRISVGEIKDSNTTQRRNTTIEWKQFNTESTVFTRHFKMHAKTNPSGDYLNGFLLDDGTIVYVLESRNNENENVPAVVYSRGPRHESGLVLSYVGTVGERSSFFPWKGKLIKITECPGETQKMLESGSYGRTWRNAVGPLSRLWDNLRGKQYFITTAIENKTLLLSAQVRQLGTDAEKREETILWFTDGNRVHNVGPAYFGPDTVVFHGLVYTNGELFSLHKDNSGTRGVLFTHLKDKLDKIKFVLSAWEKTDGFVLQLCDGTGEFNVFCTTDGLVGFLSNNTNEDATSWHDEYLFANATVIGGIRVENGFTFNEVGAGAKWRIATEGCDKQYNFLTHGLTVMATVTINHVPENDAPLLTVGSGVNDGGMRTGLWYSKNQEWKLMCDGDNEMESGLSWVPNKTYHLSLVLHNNKTITAQIRFGHVKHSLTHILAHGENFPDVESIFIGGYNEERDTTGRAVSHVTVTNVFLYNRPL